MQKFIEALVVHEASENHKDKEMIECIFDHYYLFLLISSTIATTCSGLTPFSTKFTMIARVLLSMSHFRKLLI